MNGYAQRLSSRIRLRQIQLTDSIKRLFPEPDKTTDDMLKDLALKAYEAGDDMPMIGIYVTDFGELEIVPLTREQVDKLKEP